MRWLIPLGLAILLAAPIRAAAQETPVPAPTTRPATTAPARATEEEEGPELTGMPCRCKGAGTRAPGDPLPLLSVLAPDVDGLTVSDRPQLFWYVSDEVKYPVEIALLEDDEKIIDPAFPPIHLAPPIAAGIHRVDLPQGFQLQKKKNYEWIVAVIPEPRNRSQDLVASAMVRKARAPRGPAGCWYDDFAASAARASSDPVARAACIKLLKAVGLTDVAVGLQAVGNR